MIIFSLAVLLLLIALLALTLDKTYFYRPLKELKRWAVGGDQLSKIIYQVEVYQTELKLLLWLVFGLSGAGGFLLFARVAPSFLGFFVITITLWLAFLWIPRSRLTVIGANLAVFCTPVVLRILRAVHPLNRHLASYADRYLGQHHTGLYETDDVYDLIEQQKNQVDNRITHKQLELIRRVLKFSDHFVRELTITNKRVKAVSLDDNLGPVLLGELHSSGHHYFPVYQTKPSNIVGTFFLREVDSSAQPLKVSDLYQKKVAYVHEDDNLEEALQAFYASQAHLLVVVNSYNEYVGIMTLHDMLHQLMVLESSTEIPSYDNRKVVAARHAPPAVPLSAEPDPIDQEPEVSENLSEVVE